MRDLERKTPQVLEIVKTIARHAPDVIVLQGIDYDHNAIAAQMLAELLTQYDLSLPYVLMPPTNTGVPTGLDINGDGKTDGPRDAQGYGRFFGQASVAILSRYPILHSQMRSFHETLWAEVAAPNSLSNLIPTMAIPIQRLASTVLAAVPIHINDQTLWLLTHHASPPVFDGPEDRNGHRNAAENLFWLQALDGKHGAKIGRHFILAAQINVDPLRGEGHRTEIKGLKSDPRLQNPFADWPTHDRHTVTYKSAGNLRVSDLLPSANLSVLGYGMSDDPPISDKFHHTRHRLLWIDVEFPD